MWLWCYGKGGQVRNAGQALESWAQYGGAPQ